MKTCIVCLKEKPVSEFYRYKANPDNLDSYCKLCKNKITKEYRANRGYWHHLNRNECISKRYHLFYNNSFLGSYPTIASINRAIARRKRMQAESALELKQIEKLETNELYCYF